jgi:cytochrome b561
MSNPFKTFLVTTLEELMHVAAAFGMAVIPIAGAVATTAANVETAKIVGNTVAPAVTPAVDTAIQGIEANAEQELAAIVAEGTPATPTP